MMKDEPKICYFCNNEKNYKRWSVHHINGDESDNRKENLVWAHSKCHKSFHASEREWTNESRNKMRELREKGIIGARKGHKLSEETKRKIGLANRKIDDDEVKRLTGLDMTISEIANEINFSVDAIRRSQKRQGIYIDNRRKRQR